MIQLIGRLETLYAVYHFPFYGPHIMHEFQQQAICPRVKYLVALGLMYPLADTVSLDMDDAPTYGAIGLNNTPKPEEAAPTVGDGETPNGPATQDAQGKPEAPDIRTQTNKNSPRQLW